MNGYRKMLSDKLPQMWDLALKLCKAKTKWIEYVYTTSLKKYTNKTQKSKLVKEITGHVKDSSGNTHAFDWSIDWSELYKTDKDEYNFWLKVNRWVNWFVKNGIAVEEQIKSMQYRNLSFDNAVKEMCNKFHLSNTSSTFILNQLNYVR